MSTAAVLTPRAHRLILGVEAWAHRGVVRSILVKLGVTVLGPLLILAGVAMLVLPGPGLVVMALGAALLALEYEWARRLMLLSGSMLGSARRALIPADASPSRRVAGLLVTAVLVVATTGITAAVTALLGSLVA